MALLDEFVIATILVAVCIRLAGNQDLMYELADTAVAIDPWSIFRATNHFRFLDLPRELRDIVYDYLTTETWTGMRARDQGIWSNGVTIKKDGRRSRFCTPPSLKGTYSLVRANHQIKREIQEAAARNIPHHCTLDLKINGPEQEAILSPSGKESETLLNKLLPVDARLIHLEVCGEVKYEEWENDNDAFEKHVVSASTFTNINELLAGCKKATHISVCWAFERFESDDWARMRLEVENQDYPSAVYPVIVRDAVVHVLESMPKVLKYAVVVNDTSVFASRRPGQEWQSADCVRMRDSYVGPRKGEWFEFEYDLNLSSSRRRYRLW